MNESKEFLDVKAEVSKVREMYQNDKRQESCNLLLLGQSGSGKTNLASTCVKPVHIDSFDSGGTKHLKDLIKKGEIIVDTSFEGDDPFNPKAFKAWEEKMNKRDAMNYWNYLGTYILDSSTTWSAAIMNSILKSAGIPGQAPRFTHDYHPQKVRIQNWVKAMLRMPCHFILTGHLDPVKDEVTGRVEYRYMTTGKGDITIPLEFDEIWVCDTKETSKGVEYRILTQKTGSYATVRTRIGKGVFEQYETPDMKKLLTKAKMKTDDKPLML
jgi:hypothetical protein